MSAGPVVVVPIHNALEALDACLASLDRTLPAGSPVLLADDASTDPRVEPMARGWCERSPLAARYVRRPRNLGFPANCNAAFAETGEADVVLLNSDTVVTAGWLQQLVRCAASDPRIATITPWSNNAEICSWPRFCEDNPAPEFPDAVAEAAAGLAPAYPELPTAVGFCMYVRRAALRQLGDFDAETFGRGYGEENDFCLRAAAMGWRNVLCDTAYVVHQGGASFQPLDLAPGGDNLARLLARWPDYNERVARFIMADPLAARRIALEQRLQSLDASGPQRDLFG
ncbi:MAG TPA: glycosyltransferase [Arenimonas sp.]|uniref:glycosyltransferase family 2 protein n=1 Tax=Arenimonas sp. TaxID=1872635 RepID=UPI002D7EFD69|nr:glycosyltransferase [Arenimonas sp.]HEU0151897.1 glycosyltransferase [Arenimonas sp.]